MQTDYKIRVRHYTRKNRADIILQEQRILAGAENKVFVEKASNKLLSPRAAEEKYKLAPGKGNAVIEFDIRPDELQSQFNPLIKGKEDYLEGDVDLRTHNPTRIR